MSNTQNAVEQTSLFDTRKKLQPESKIKNCEVFYLLSNAKGVFNTAKDTHDFVTFSLSVRNLYQNL